MKKQGERAEEGKEVFTGNVHFEPWHPNHVSTLRQIFFCDVSSP